MQRVEMQGSSLQGDEGAEDPSPREGQGVVSTASTTPNIFLPLLGQSREGPYLHREALLLRFIPKRLPFREGLIATIADGLRCTLIGEGGAHQLLVGTTGCGKSATANHVVDQLEEAAARAGAPLHTVRLTCARYEGTYQLLLALTRTLPGSPVVAAHGWPLERVYAALGTKLEALGAPVVLILDELDTLPRPVIEEVLHLLCERNSELRAPGLTLVLILNNSALLRELSPRVSGRLGARPLVFPPYDATQLQRILADRAEEALLPGSLSEGVLALCAARAAQEHGDARRALELLRGAADEAAAAGVLTISELHVRQALARTEGDVLTAVTLGLPLPARLMVLAVADAARARGVAARRPNTREVLKHFTQRCAIAGISLGGSAALTSRGTQLLTELMALGVLEVPRAAPGRTPRGICVLLHESQLEELVSAEPRLGAVHLPRSVQRRL